MITAGSTSDPSGPLRSSAPAGSAPSTTAERGLCVFDLAAGRFALDVGLVGEVVPVERAIVVPRSPRAVLGLFNLRGVAVALVDLEAVLAMPSPPTTRPVAAPLALVLRTGPSILAALRVQAVITVVPATMATAIAADRAVDHPAITGFVSVPVAGTVSVLDGHYLQQRLATLRPR